MLRKDQEWFLAQFRCLKFGVNLINCYRHKSKSKHTNGFNEAWLKCVSDAYLFTKQIMSFGLSGQSLRPAPSDAMRTWGGRSARINHIQLLFIVSHSAPSKLCGNTFLPLRRTNTKQWAPVQSSLKPPETVTGARSSLRHPFYNWIRSTTVSPSQLTAKG